jgi:zinc protease
MARREKAAPVPAWVGDLPVFERVLGNGLKALVLPRPGSPVVVCDLYYPVGSVDEPPGQSGLAHFVEHMLFKGTAWLPKGQIDRLAFLAAGQSNAETGEDCTHYWFAFPLARWELALAVEADRMRHATFDPREVEAERQVIAEERSRELDAPLGRLDQEHLAVSYLVHPYRNPILGWADEVRRLSVADLTAFYAAHYRPDGAVLVLVGDLDPDDAFARVERHFGPLEPGPTARPDRPAPEPPQHGRRAFTLEEPDGVVRGLLGWHTVPRDHPDGPALDVLADILACGRRSRLWDRLVERDRLATWVDATQEAARLAGQMLVQVEAAAGTDPERLEAAVVDVLEALARRGPTAAELARSRLRLEAAWRWEQEDLAGLAAGLGQAALWGDWRSWQADHRAALAVRAADVRRVASRYLRERALTVGWSLPRPGQIAARPVEGPPPSPRPAAVRIAAVPTASAIEPPMPLAVPALRATLVDYKPRRVTLANGLRLLTERRPGTGTVALEVYCDSGVLREAKPGVAYLAGRLREEGTAHRDAEAIACAIEDVGGTLDVSSTGVSLRVRAEDLELAVTLAAELMREPTFPEDVLPWQKRRIAAELQADRDDAAFAADLAFRGLIYGDHPYARDPRGTARQIASLTRADVLEHHRRLTVPENTFVVAAGDLDARQLKALVNRAFGGWAPGGDGPEPIPEPKRDFRPRNRRIAHPGEQVHLLIGHLGVARLDPAFDALAVLDHILGSGPGFSDRLSRVLRDEMGLAYAVGGGFTDSADLAPGLFRVYIGTGPGEADRALAMVMEQIRAMHQGDFADEEVERARQYLADSWVFDYQTVGQRAERLLELERGGLPLDEPLRWPERIAAITPAQVRLAARRHLHPEALVVVEYGAVAGRARRRAGGGGA